MFFEIKSMIFIHCLVIGVTIAFFWVMLSGMAKRSSSPIIDIRDVEMILIDKKRQYDPDFNDYDYWVLYESVDHSFKRSFYISFENYKKYNVGDVVLLQEVIYKGKKGVFSDIVFAQEKHYKRLENYKKQNKDIIDGINAYTEEDLRKYHNKEERVKRALIISIVLVIGISIFMAVPRF